MSVTELVIIFFGVIAAWFIFPKIGRFGEELIKKSIRGNSYKYGKFYRNARR